MDLYLIYGSAQDIPRYDCRPYNYSEEDLIERGDTNIFLGVSFIAYGVFAELCYVVAMIGMFSKDLRQLSCYKIMIALGIFDMLALGVNSLLTGYMWLIGGWFCTHPDLLYITGALGVGLWTGACMNCFVLVVNRLIDLWKPHLMPKLFGGKRTLVVLCIPLFYSIYFTFFTPPHVFNSQMSAWFFDPFIGDNETEPFYNVPHTTNNLLIVVATCILYSLVVAVVMKKFNQAQSGQRRKMNGNQLSIIFQSSLICMANLVAALIYVYMQFFPTPQFMILIGHMSWQAGHGIPAFVYLLMNKSIRHEVRRNLHLGKGSTVTVTKEGTYGQSDASRNASRNQTSDNIVI